MKYGVRAEPLQYFASTFNIVKTVKVPKLLRISEGNDYQTPSSLRQFERTSYHRRTTILLAPRWSNEYIYIINFRFSHSMISVGQRYDLVNIQAEKYETNTRKDVPWDSLGIREFSIRWKKFKAIICLPHKEKLSSVRTAAMNNLLPDQRSSILPE
jgi:hypothetical protein